MSKYFIGILSENLKNIEEGIRVQEAKLEYYKKNSAFVLNGRKQYHEEITSAQSTLKVLSERRRQIQNEMEARRAYELKVFQEIGD